MKWYYYLHTNGDLIGKNPVAVDYNGANDYFESDFVRKYWLIDTTNRENAWTFICEALAMGARIDRAKELSEKWCLTVEDLEQYIIHNPKPSDLQKDGMDKFIIEILKLEPDEVWDAILEKHKS